MPLVGAVNKCGDRSRVKTERDNPSSFRVGAGNAGGRGSTGRAVRIPTDTREGGEGGRGGADALVVCPTGDGPLSRSLKCSKLEKNPDSLWFGKG